MQLLLIVVRLCLLFLIPSLFLLIKFTVFFLCIWKFGVLELKKHAVFVCFLSVYYFPSSFNFFCEKIRNEKQGWAIMLNLEQLVISLSSELL